MHLADAFIQSDLQYIQAIHFFATGTLYDINLLHVEMTQRCCQLHDDYFQKAFPFLDWFYCWGLWETVLSRSSGLYQHTSWRISERVYQLNIGRYGTKCHWDFLAADLVCSQNIEHLRRGIIITLHIWRLSSFLQIYQISWVSYFTSLVCDQEREGVKLSIWSTQGSPTACLNISKRVLTLKHVFSFSTKHAAAINGDLSVSFSFQSLSTRRWRFRSK